MVWNLLQARAGPGRHAGSDHLQVMCSYFSDCARTIYVYVEFDEDVNKLVGGMYVLDLDADVIQYKRQAC